MRVQSNESKVRTIALFVMVLGLIYGWSRTIWIPFFLVVDFFLRAANLGRFSPLAIVSGVLVRSLQLPEKPVYMPPKRFAAFVGLAFSILIAILALTNVNPIVPLGILILFAALESLAGICAGCYVYDYLQKLKRTSYR